MRSFAGVHLTRSRIRLVLGLVFAVLAVGLSPWGDPDVGLFGVPGILGLPPTFVGGVAFLASLLCLLDWDAHR